jgi:hypothetical protein
MDFSKISTTDLQTYAEKLGVYINDLNTLMQLLYNARKASKHFKSDVYEPETIQKIQDCQDIYNAIQLEIEKRVLTDLNFKLEYEKFTDYTVKAKNTIANQAIIGAKQNAQKPMKVIKSKTDDTSQ